MDHLAGKTMLVTGASRGIGEAAARLFVKAGANVALVARSEDAIADLAGELGPQSIAIPCDVSRYWEVSKAIDATVETFGRLDILINNAGVIEPICHLLTSDPESWSHAIDINLKGVYNGMRAALPIMADQGHGTILTISSGAAHSPIEAWSHYCASKAGAAMLTSSADLEARALGIRCMGLSPGTVATQMQREIKSSGVNPVSKLDWSDHIPPEWPAKTLAWMCSDAANDWVGKEISLRDETIRRQVGLI